ncbi:MAG: T9SS type A sorting domain-containing protein [Saprospiraceae bacterium]|nr:T9SS type A sorting domain-containing protein [Saprospiraceae bacterium]
MSTYLNTSLPMNLFTKISCLALIFIFCQHTTAQQNHPSCDGSRYRTTVFSDVDTTLAVKFGENTTIAGTFQELFMDIYEPAGDVVTDRPAIILAFGGSFISGDRSQLSTLCDNFARQGYVCSCIDYRLYDGALFPFPDSTVMVDEVVKSVSDMKAAIRYLRKDAATVDSFGIDADYIFVGGASAGAITALHTAYLGASDSSNIPSFIQTAIDNNDGFEGNSTIDSMDYINYSSDVQGVINYSGALARSVWITNDQTPVFSVHDDADPIVPYGQGFAALSAGPFTINIIYMEGSFEIEEELDSATFNHELITIPNSTGHVSYLGDPVWEDSVLTSSSEFLYNELCSDLTSYTELLKQSIQHTAVAFPNPSAQDILIRFDQQPSTYSLVVYDATGRLLQQMHNLTDQEIQLNRADFETGLYFVQLRFDDPSIPSIQQKVIFK